MKPSFKDHFSAHASAYARYRPGYPDALFAYVASRCTNRALAWDCGTGNGQAALGLARHFTRVVATDASAGQIAQATPHARITYHVAPAAHSPLATGTADLVTVAQAIHWFDFDPFYAEAHRVLTPGGVLAVWTYGLQRVTPAVDRLLLAYYHDVVGLYWPPERRLVDEAYQTIPFPFEEEPTPAFHIERTWPLDDVLGYLSTWSATRRFMHDRGTNPVDQIMGELATAWGNPEATKTIRWPLYLRVGRTPDRTSNGDSLP